MEQMRKKLLQMLDDNQHGILHASNILIRIRVVKAESEIFWKLWYRKHSIMWNRLHCRWRIRILHCVIGSGSYSFHIWLKSNIRMSVLLVHSKLWESRTAFEAKHLPIPWEASNPLNNEYQVPNFYLVYPFYTQNIAHNIS